MSIIKIGILSDTHRRTDLQEAVIAKLKYEGAKYLLHLGDLELEDNLVSLKNSGLPYAAVFGNNDIALRGLEREYKIAQEPYYLKIKDIKIKMMHMPYYMSADSDIVLFGHLHKFSVEYKNETLFLNPGEVCARNKNLTECVLLEIEKKNYTVNYFYREPNASKWNSKVFEFKGN